jgi:anti-anti-sigma regulatory factor
MFSPPEGDVTVLHFPHRDLTAETARDVLPPGTRQRLELDLGSVESLTAGGLGTLVTLHTALRTRGGGPTLRNVGGHVYEVLAVTHLNQLFEVRPLAQGAVEPCRRSA